MWRRGGDVAVVTALRRWRGGASRRCQPSLSISLGFEVGNGGGSDEPRTPSCKSPPPLYRTARRGPTSLFLGWAPLISARVKSSNMAVGPSLVERSLTDRSSKCVGSHQVDSCTTCTCTLPIIKEDCGVILPIILRPGSGRGISVCNCLVVLVPILASVHLNFHSFRDLTGLVQCTPANFLSRSRVANCPRL